MTTRRMSKMSITNSLNGRRRITLKDHITNAKFLNKQNRMPSCQGLRSKNWIGYKDFLCHSCNDLSKLIPNSHSNAHCTYILKNGPIEVCLHKTRIRRFPSRSLSMNLLTGTASNLPKLLQKTPCYASHLIQRLDHLTSPHLILAIPKSPAKHRKNFRILWGTDHQLKQVPKRIDPIKFRG